MARITLNSAQLEAFDRDGFVIVENVLEPAEIEAARSRIEPLFAGKFETGLYPDEWNWKTGKDRPDVTRQICNAWKSDRTIAAIVLRPDVGKACATLRGWPGARMNQDNVIWKPPGTKPLGFHQDDSYQQWIDPPELMTCWITLDDTRADQGTIEYVRGSHRWPVAPPIKQFHAPDDPLEDMRVAAVGAGIKDPEIVPIVVRAGSAVFHHGQTWHGSRDNRGSAPRRSVIAHCASSTAKFHPTNIGYVYGRYKRAGTLEMDESFFPIMWREDGYRTPWLDAFIGGERAAA
jgi:ectoine hydroxylase-related dioxygenase (phytanoyl-CoA dioxygenase family)